LETSKRINNQEKQKTTKATPTKPKKEIKTNEEISIEKEILENRKNKKDEEIEIITKKPNFKLHKNKFNNLKIKYKKDPKKFVIMASSLLLVLSLIIGTSYAALSYLSKTNNTTRIESGTLALEIKNEANSITLQGALPEEDSDGLKNEKEYEFSVKNTGSVPAHYKITLDNTCSLERTYQINDKEKTPDKCIPNEYIKIGLKKGEEEYKVLEYDKEKNEYILETGLIEKEQEESYKMKIWLDYDTPNDYNSKGIYTIIYSGKLNIKYEQTTEKFDNNTYQIKYNANGGEGQMENTTFSYSEEKSLSKNTFTKEGYSFLGWATSKESDTIIYTDEEKVKSLTTEDNGLINLYAVWGKQTKTIRVSVVNGTSAQTEKVLNYGGSAVFNLIPTEGYTNPSITCTNSQKGVINGNTLTVSNVTEDSACTITYNTSTYKIVYNMNGAAAKAEETITYEETKNIQVPTKTFTVNITNSASATLSEATASKAQTFKGWTSNENAGLNVETAKTGETSANTSWDGSLTTNTYFKNLNSKGESITLTANWTPTDVTLPTVTKTGYNCGYTQTEGASSVAYKSGATYTPSPVTSNVTLYTVCEPKQKNVTFKIEYDTSIYPGPSAEYSTSEYQTISKTSSSLAYGASETITASPAYPDDRYTGSVSCTNEITASLTEGTGTTSRTDEVTVTNNSDTETSSVCTITYTPKWKGIAAGTYTAGANFPTENYANTAYGWTVVKDNGDNVGLAYNASVGTGKYADAGSVLTEKFTNSIIVNDRTQGGLIKQGDYYLSTDSGISTGGSTATNYWTGEGKFYNSEARNYYYTKSEKYIQSSYNGRKKLDSMKQVEEFNQSTYASTLGSVASASKNIISTSPAKITVNGSSVTPYSVSNGIVTFNKASYSYTTSDNYYSQYGRNNTFTGGNGTRINTAYQMMKWNGSAWTITDEANITSTYRYTFYSCGGSWHGEPVVYRYKNSTEFYYGHKGADVGWSGTSFSTSNAEVRDYETDDGNQVGNFAGYASTDCTNKVNCTSTTITSGGTDYTRYHRTYRFDNYNSNAYCSQRRNYTTSDSIEYIYYRAYIIVRER